MKSIRTINTAARTIRNTKTIVRTNRIAGTAVGIVEAGPQEIGQLIAAPPPSPSPKKPLALKINLFLFIYMLIIFTDLKL